MTKTPIKDLVDNINGKVVIMVEKNSNTGGMPILYRSANMWELTNITTNSVYIHEKRFTDIKNTNSPKEVVDFNRQNMTIVLPDLNENNTNYIYVVPRLLGCQFIAMNFQNKDQNLISYNSFLITANVHLFLDLLNCYTFRFLCLHPNQLIRHCCLALKIL